MSSQAKTTIVTGASQGLGGDNSRAEHDKMIAKTVKNVRMTPSRHLPPFAKTG